MYISIDLHIEKHQLSKLAEMSRLFHLGDPDHTTATVACHESKVEDDVLVLSFSAFEGQHDAVRELVKLATTE